MFNRSQNEFFYRALDCPMHPTSYDFRAVHHCLQSYVDRDILAGVSSAVLVRGEVVDIHCAGLADREAGIALHENHLFRIFSNTKLITSIAVMQLVEAKKFALDDAIERYMPQLGRRQVLRPGAKRLDDTEPARSSITVRQLLSHSSGLSYGLLDHGSMMYNAYVERKALNAYQTLAQMMDVLETLPLLFHPGTAWEYSIASDVLSRLVEVVSGLSFDDYIQQYILNPLNMRDTYFVIPAEEQHRLTAIYAGSDPGNVLRRGLKRLTKMPFQDAFLKPVPRLSGGGGLISSLPDMVALMRSLMSYGPQLLAPETLALMMQNHLPADAVLSFPGVGIVAGKGFGLGGAITLAPAEMDSPDAHGEFEWGGIAGTHWWISPRHELAGILMTQRHMSFWHPFSSDFKRLVYQAVLGR